MQKVSSVRRSGFTLMQLLVVISIISLLGAGMFTVFNRGQATAQRVQCDAHLKTIALALDAHRQEYGQYPQMLQELVDKKYLTLADLHCPTDPDPDGTYESFYAPRAPHDSGELPTLVCPLHEAQGRGGEQAYLGRYVKQFSTRPARLMAANGVTVQSPGGQPSSGTAGMELHGADIVRTGTSGLATIQFADGSTASLQGNTQITLLQSFVAGQVQAPLYTILRQIAGTVTYQVHTGSKFDVVTPTATAGALGTKFDIKVSGSGTASQTSIFLYQGRVRLTTIKTSALAPLGALYTITSTSLGLPGLLPLPGGLLPNLPLVPGVGGGGGGGLLPGIPGLP